MVGGSNSGSGCGRAVEKLTLTRIELGSLRSADIVSAISLGFPCSRLARSIRAIRPARGSGRRCIGIRVPSSLLIPAASSNCAITNGSALRNADRAFRPQKGFLYRSSASPPARNRISPRSLTHIRAKRKADTSSLQLRAYCLEQAPVDFGPGVARSAALAGAASAQSQIRCLLENL